MKSQPPSMTRPAAVELSLELQEKALEFLSTKMPMLVVFLNVELPSFCGNSFLQPREFRLFVSLFRHSPV